MYNPQLETFIKVADAGSFNKAARDSYISPTAVIKQINLLEKSLGVKLFERTHRGIKITSAGKFIYNDAKYIISYSKESVIRAKNAQEKDKNIIRIGSSLTTPAQSLISLLEKNQEFSPDIKFQIVSFENTPENAREILSNLGKDIDVVGGVYDDTRIDSRKYAGIKLGEKSLYCALSIKHRLAEKEKISIEDLYGEKLMIIQRGWSVYIDRLRDYLIENHPEIEIVDFDFYDVNVFNRCENMNYILLAIKDWQNIHPMIKLVSVDWDYSIPYGLVYPRNPSGLIEKFIDRLKDVKDGLV